MEKNKNQGKEEKSKGGNKRTIKGGKETNEDSKSDERKIEQGKPLEES